VTAELELGARRCPLPTAEGAALLCRGQLAGDIDLLLAAIDAYDRGPRPADGARAREAAAAALFAASRANEAIGLLEEARTTYQQLGAVPALARSEAALRALGVRRRRATTRRPATVGWESLTRMESQVVHLVVGGLTNRQVGERLFVSRRTVETHLGHVFQKLGFSTRVQLTAEAVRRVV
jgi:DNA-binding CsgD family transcriptional regulator